MRQRFARATGRLTMSVGRWHRDGRSAAAARLTAALVVLVAASSPASAQGTPQGSPARPASSPAARPADPQPAQIDRNGVLILVRSTLLALHHANQTGNYTVLRDLGAPGFQANNAAKLAEIFASQRAQNLDLSGVAVLEPQLTRVPQIVQGGMMHMAGIFPSVPLQLNFELLFAPVEGRWRLFGVSVNVGQSGPVAPQADSRPEAAATPQPSPAALAPPGGSATQRPPPVPPGSRPPGVGAPDASQPPAAPRAPE